VMTVLSNPMKLKFITTASVKIPSSGKSAIVFGGGRGWPKPKLTRSLLVLIAANLIPIFGVLFFGWTLFEILYLYWLESVIIGIFNIPKMLLAQGGGRKRFQRLFGFLVGYGAFAGGELMALAGLFGGPGGTMVESHILTDEHFQAVLGYTPVVLIPLVVLFISHGISFFVNFIRKKEYLYATSEEQAMASFKRIIIMHIALGVGGALTARMGSPILALLLLGFLKIVFDGDAHAREHTRLADRQKDIPKTAANPHT